MKRIYTLGFGFNADADKVVLIEKDRPEWQKGTFNGVGGKVNINEELPIAMWREFKEETGVTIFQSEWNMFACLHGDGYEMYCFRVFSDKVLDAKTMESEKVHILTLEEAFKKPLTSSLQVLLPMALDTNFAYSSINHLG